MATGSDRWRDAVMLVSDTMATRKRKSRKEGFILYVAQDSLVLPVFLPIIDYLGVTERGEEYRQPSGNW